MKKILLLSLAAGYTLLASAAVPSRQLNPQGRDDIRTVKIDAKTIAELSGDRNLRKAAQKAEGDKEMTMYYSLADEPYTALGFNGAKAGDIASMAFEIPADVATSFAGNVITSIYFSTGVRNSGNTQKNYVTVADVFITDDLQGEPLLTAKATMTEEAFAPVRVDLEEPYTIEAGKGIYIGVNSKIKSAKDYAIVVDYMYHEGYEGGWVAANGNWDNISEYYGFCCVGAIMTGTNMPTDMATVNGFDVSPYQLSKSPVECEIAVRNRAANLLESFELTFQVGDNAPVAHEFTLEQGISFGQTTYVAFDGISCPVASPEAVDITVKVTKVNGKPFDEDPGFYSEVIFIDPDKAFDRTVVIEEFTGTWCGWCPRGIVGMEYVSSHYTTDQVVGIAAHGSDEMAINAYVPVINAFTSGFPNSAISRMYTTDPSAAALASYIDYVLPMPTNGNITGSVEYNESHTAITFNTTTEFSFDYTKANFGIEYVLTEDNVGPYTQQNYYAGGGSGEMGGWEKKGSEVKTMYDEVARVLDTYGGVKGSVPTAIEAGKKYEFSHTVAIPADADVTDEETGEVTLGIKRNDLHAIVLLVDNTNGFIVNAAEFKLPYVDGINNIVSDSSNADAPVEYYNLQGVRVSNPENGLFIRRQGGKVEKIVK